MQGHQNKKDGLYDVDFKITTDFNVTNEKIQNIECQQINIIVQVYKNKVDLAQLLHRTLFSPKISTLQKAIANNHFLTWPGIDQVDFKKLVLNSILTALGHLNQERNNLQSTKIKKQAKDIITDNDC